MTIIDEMPVRDPVVVEGDPADLADTAGPDDWWAPMEEVFFHE